MYVEGEDRVAMGGDAHTHACHSTGQISVAAWHCGRVRNVKSVSVSASMGCGTDNRSEGVKTADSPPSELDYIR